MVQPLALLVYEKVLPGTQLVNRMQDRGYRVESLSDVTALAEEAEREKPMLVVIDLAPRHESACQAIVAMREKAATSHIPIIALTPPNDHKLQEAARKAGATLAVYDSAILVHLDQLLQQALELD